MPKQELLRRAAALVTAPISAEVAQAYTDQPVFPAEVVVQGPTDADTSFPGWPGDVLLLAHENQGVCAWGLVLDGASAGSVVVGGDLRLGDTTVVYANSLEEYLTARRWDRACFEQEPLLQAQAGPIDEAALDVLARLGREGIATNGWPCSVSRRFEVGEVRLMVWVDDDCCDWWVSGPEGTVRSLVPELLTLSDLHSTLWSNDALGEALLRELVPRR